MGINKQGYEAKMNEHQNQMQKGEYVKFFALHCYCLTNSSAKISQQNNK